MLLVWADGRTKLLAPWPARWEDSGQDGWIEVATENGTSRAFQRSSPALAIGEDDSDEREPDGVVVYIERPMALLRARREEWALRVEATRKEHERVCSVFMLREGW